MTPMQKKAAIGFEAYILMISEIPFWNKIRKEMISDKNIGYGHIITAKR